MGRREINVLIFTAVCLFLLTACNSDATNENPVSLPEVACKPEDVNADPPFTIAETHSAVPPETPLADQIETYYGVALIENSLTNSSAFCNLYEMADETAAAKLWAQLCRDGVTPVETTEAFAPPTVGDSACAYQSAAFRELHFQQGRIVVSVWGDSGGQGVVDWAEAVNGRLQQSN
ncbi:MAG: hypothetical protein KC434_19315 [Anaerolineales bacterium]|nr:hypothetical protein [Anaerolineales bacterium]